MTVLLDAAGRRRSPATMPGWSHAGMPTMPRQGGTAIARGCRATLRILLV
jgi:hypothetical protein